MTSRAAHMVTLALLLLSGCAGKPVRRTYEFPGTRKDYPEETVFVSSPKTRVPDKDRLPKELPRFCKLNPEACPDLIEKLAPPKPKPSQPKPSPKPSQPSSAEEVDEPEEMARDPWKFFACMQACKGGREAGQAFCTALPGRTAKQRQIKAICYAAVAAGTASCEVFCEGYFKPRKSP